MHLIIRIGAMRIAPGLALASIWTVTAAGGEVVHDRPSDAPVTYIRDYDAGHLDDPAFLAAIAANTPDLLVLGKDAPLHHNWGPVAGTGGENQEIQGQAN